MVGLLAATIADYTIDIMETLNFEMAAQTSQVRGRSFEINANENQQNLILTNLYNSRDDDLSEKVILECKDGRILAHKWILTAGSDYFRGMFNHGNIENSTNKASFLDITCEVMNIIIKFIYGQDIPTRPEITDALIRETLVAADKMQLNVLFNNYWILYTTSITLDNFLNIWQLAEMFNDEEMLKNIEIFVLHHMKQISETDVFSDITENQMTSLNDPMNTDKYGDFIVFYLTWSIKTSKTSLTTKRGLNFISNCGLENISDYSLRSLLSADVVKN
uniref:BTB domain-containing protein n=1 Tax=Strigamia maritima TaxID=126957 RepID=T1J066_STRMM